MTTTKRACVIGFPIAHSRSPLIHGYWLRHYAIDGTYERAEVRPESFASFIADLPARGFIGGNVTVPHKEAAFRLATVEDPVAEALEAANLLWLEGGVLKAANTDVAGFLGNLDEFAPGWDRDLGKAVVLGAGGAARAVVYALFERGARDIVILNRSHERAQALALRFGESVRALPVDELENAMEGAAILVNATSLGMQGQAPLDIDLGPLPGDALVADLVYVPLETALLARARARGNPTVDGLGMLLHQAVPSFQTWFGIRPEVSGTLRDYVVADLTRTLK